MRARESSTSYNTKGNRVVERKPLRTDERAQEGKQAMLLYSQTSPEDINDSNEREKEHKMGNIYRLFELNAGH